MLLWELSAKLSTYIKLPPVSKAVNMGYFKCLHHRVFTVYVEIMGLSLSSTSYF